MHSDLFLQYLALIRPHQDQLTFDDSLFIAKIPSLALSIEKKGIENLAASLYALFQGYPPFSGLDRYCIAKRSGYSNHLEVISSLETDNSSNRLNPGYSCFVKPESTLLKLSPFNIRIFKDINKVAQSFAADGLPPQRSIKRLADAGFKSGVCIPLFTKKSSWGYLFFNSHTDRLSKLSSLDFMIMSFIQSIVAQNIPPTQICSDLYYRLGSTLQHLYGGTEPQMDTVASTITSHSALLDHALSVKVSIDGRIRSLFSSGNLANLISRLAAYFQWKTLHVAMSETKNGLAIRVHWGSGQQPSWDNFLIQPIFDDAKILGFSTSLEMGAIHLVQKIDPIDPQNPVAYSTEYE